MDVEVREKNGKWEILADGVRKRQEQDSKSYAGIITH
jgi:hypothetical protein